ncbi:hypothetical protein Tco_0074350 [Tanacetum coccineum]
MPKKTTQEDKDGFVDVKKKKKAKSSNKSKQSGGVRLTKPMPSYYYRRVEKWETSKDDENKDTIHDSLKLRQDKEVVMKNSFKALMNDETNGMSDETNWLHAKQSLNVINESDNEEVDQVIDLETYPNISKVTEGESTPKSMVPNV